MDYTSGADNIGGQFTDGDPGAGQQATVVDSLWLNGVQNELVKLISDSGLTPSAASDVQIREAIRRWVSSENQLFNANGYEKHIGQFALGDFSTSYKQFRDGWSLKKDAGITLTQITSGATGLLIQGTGGIGDTFTIYQYYAKALYQNRAFNLGLSPQASRVYTGAVRAATLAANPSVAMTVDIAHNPNLDTVLTITDGATTQGSLAGGGGADSQALASTRYDAVNKSDQGNVGALPVGPEITVTLEAAGTFAIYFNGCGLWEGYVADDFIPSCIIGDNIQDQAVIDAHFRDRYDISEVLYGLSGWADPLGAGPTYTSSTINVWVPLPEKLGFSATTPETNVFNITGTVGGQTISGVNSASVQTGTSVSGSRGVRIALNVNHPDVGSGNLQEINLNLSLQIRQGASF